MLSYGCRAIVSFATENKFAILVFSFQFCIGDVLQWLAGNATKSLDMTVQYWELLAEPENSKSGDYGYSEADMKKFGADVGRQVYKSLVNTADRDIGIRYVLS